MPMNSKFCVSARYQMNEYDGELGEDTTCLEAPLCLGACRCAVKNY